MWKWGLLLFSLLLLVVGAGWWQRAELLSWVREQQARQLIYEEGSLTSRYSGRGEKVIKKDKEYLIEPNGVGVPFFLTEADDMSKYQNLQYKITELPAQEKLLYVVGRVKGWENIEGSVDKYLVLDSGKYRIGFASSGLYGYEMDGVTALMVEDVSERFDEAVNVIKKPQNPRLSEIGYENLKKIIKWGNSVVLIPVFDPPTWSSRDENGYYVIAQIIVRRSGGEL